MVKNRKSAYITWGVILVVIILAITLIYLKSVGGISQESARCIGENSVLYVQTGCHACKTQEELFGESFQELTVVNCYEVENRAKCIEVGISYTPTWIINNQEYIGVKSIDKLKNLTGC
jgi:hypothetical protein